MLAAKHLLLCIALLPMWALPPAHEATTNEITKCNCIKRDATPTLPQLTSLEFPEMGVSVQIMDRIGSDYLKLGTHLLNDEDGGTMKAIEHDYKSTEEKLNEIFRCWIKGQGQLNGKKANTWEMLVISLKNVKLMTLADKIESVLQFCAERTMHLNEEECAHEYMHEAIMATKSLLQTKYLISMLAAVVVVGAASFHCRSIADDRKSDVSDDKLEKYTAYLKSLYKAKTQASFTGDNHWPPPVTNKVFSLAMIMPEKCND